MKQRYNSRLDESLGARNGKKTQSLKDRRDESKGAEKGAGKRAYSSVSTMDNPKKRKVTKTNKDGVKTRQVSKNGVVKKTVTRTKGGVEKEIERGNKRIEVQKYKDEGEKNRTVIDMVKNSAFKNLPHSMVKEAAKPENNVLPANRMDKFMQGANKAFISAATKYAEKQRKENK